MLNATDFCKLGHYMLYVITKPFSEFLQWHLIVYKHLFKSFLKVLSNCFYSLVLVDILQVILILNKVDAAS